MKRISIIALMLATALSFSCGKTGKDTDEKGKKEKAKGLAVQIDGKFEDWAALDPKVVSVAKNDPNSPWDAVNEIRCCSDADFVYYYIKYNSQVLNEQLENKEELPIRLNLNTDGEFTSGYKSYSLDGYDFIVEGALGDQNGGFGEFAGTLHFRTMIDKDGEQKEGWKELIPSTGGLVIGKGAGNEYEILLARELFDNAVPAGHKMGDVFYTGIRFYGNGGWGELSNLPNASVDEGEGNGWAHLMKVTTTK